MKYCKKCNTLKDLSLFGRDYRNMDEKHIWCKDCVNAYHRQRYKENPAVRAYESRRVQRKYVEDIQHRERRKEYFRQYHKNKNIIQYSEEEIKNRFISIFDSLSVEYESNVLTSCGYIDFLLYTPSLKIVELKRAVTTKHVQCCLGQLLLYGSNYPNAKLYAYFPIELPKYFIETYNRHSVEIWNWNSFYLELDIWRNQV